MYKTKMIVWILVFVLWITSMVAPGVFKSFDTTDVTFSSDATQVMRNLNKQKIAGNKLFATNNNAEIAITSVPVDGIKEDEKYYSPIIGFTRSNNCGSSTCIGGLDSIYTGDFAKIFDGFLQGKKWNEVTSSSSKEEINVSVDADSEKEIKNFIYLSLLEIYDADVARDKTIECWNKAIKIKSLDNIEDEANTNGTIIIGPEYIYGASTITNAMFKVNPKETVAKYFYVYIISDLHDREALLEMLRDNKFMKKSGLRRLSYNGVYNKGLLNDYDSALKIVEVSVEWDNVVIESEELKELLNTIKEEKEQTIIDEESQTSDNSAAVQDDSSIINNSSEFPTSSDDANWEINKKEELLSDEISNRDINPNAYGAEDNKINQETVSEIVVIALIIMAAVFFAYILYFLISKR